MHVCQRVETKEDEITIGQEKRIVATYADNHVKDIDPLWFLLLFSNCFPNAQGLHGK